MPNPHPKPHATSTTPGYEVKLSVHLYVPFNCYMSRRWILPVRILDEIWPRVPQMTGHRPQITDMHCTTNYYNSVRLLCTPTQTADARGVAVGHFFQPPSAPATRGTVMCAITLPFFVSLDVV